MDMVINKKRITSLTFLFTITYLISYVTRINYGAVIAEMIATTGYTKAALSAAVTGGFITYGAGQLVSGYFGDRIQPKHLVLFGLVVSSVMNMLIPLCRSAEQMLVIWCINGFAQSFMWPPIVKLMTALFSGNDYKRASVLVSWGSSFGTIAVYLISPLMISLSGWKSVFVVSALLGVAMSFMWFKFCPEIEKKASGGAVSKRSSKAALLSPLILFIMLAIVLQGAVRDSVTTWMPSYISETYALSNEISILSGVVLPIFGIICFYLTSMLYRKVFQNPLLCAGVIFAVGAVSAVLLSIVSGISPILSVLFTALLTGSMHGVNLILICMLPPYFKGFGNVSFISGLLNSCTYIGSAISIYGIALISDNSGWHSTLIIWIVLAALGAVICTGCFLPWRDFCIKSASDSDASEKAD